MTSIQEPVTSWTAEDSKAPIQAGGPSSIQKPVFVPSRVIDHSELYRRKKGVARKIVGRANKMAAMAYNLYGKGGWYVDLQGQEGPHWGATGWAQCGPLRAPRGWVFLGFSLTQSPPRAYYSSGCTGSRVSKGNWGSLKGPEGEESPCTG